MNLRVNKNTVGTIRMRLGDSKASCAHDADEGVVVSTFRVLYESSGIVPKGIKYGGRMDKESIEMVDRAFKQVKEEK